MSSFGYPTAFVEIIAWARQRKVSLQEARFRFAQYGVLRALAGSRSLSQTLVLKGGNALDFVWIPNRSTQDLDFTVNGSEEEFETRLRDLQGALDAAARDLDSRYKIHSTHRNPRSRDREMATWQVKIGYALRDDHTNRKKLDEGGHSTQTIELEASVNEVVCEHAAITIDGAANPLSVCTLEDIVAEKLRSLLQQKIRNRNRQQDLLDIVVAQRQAQQLDLAKVSKYLRAKCLVRSIDPTLSAFRDPEIKTRAQTDYGSLQKMARSMFVDFETAWSELEILLGQLGLEQ